MLVPLSRSQQGLLSYSRRQSQAPIKGEGLLRRDSLKLFSQTFALAILADDKAQDRQASEAQKSKEMLELCTGMDNLRIVNNQLKDLR